MVHGGPWSIRGVSRCFVDVRDAAQCTVRALFHRYTIARVCDKHCDIEVEQVANTLETLAASFSGLSIYLATVSKLLVPVKPTGSL